jgi:NADPH:quinone reductase-like Zn-dependent oxidoreductase
MKSVEYKEYGSPEVLKIVNVDKPVPKENEVLVRVYSTTVTATECTFRKGVPYFSRLFTGLKRPKITTPGEELSGKIESIGRDVKLFRESDSVFGTAGPGFGANAEYICIPEDGVLCLKPENVNFDEAASSVDGFLTSLPFLRDKGNIKSGQKVLIYGASGSVGSAAVQIAKYYGAEVTGVCSTSNLELVKRLGAEKAVDYLKEDFTDSGNTYDIIFDAVGKISFPDCKKSLTPYGIFLEAGIGIGIIPHVILTSVFPGKKAKIAATGLRSPKERKADLQLLKELIESEKIKPVIDRIYSLDEISDAHTYADKGHKKGNVVISVFKENQT